MSKNLKFPLESRADGEGKLARRRNIKSASFHSEIYTAEYSKTSCSIERDSISMSRRRTEGGVRG